MIEREAPRLPLLAVYKLLWLASFLWLFPLMLATVYGFPILEFRPFIWMILHLAALGATSTLWKQGSSVAAISVLLLMIGLNGLVMMLL